MKTVLSPEKPFHLYHGDCLEFLKTLPTHSVHAIVTDPPYGLGEHPDPVAMLSDWLTTGHHEVKGKGFMGKAWDAFVPQPRVWRECFRVLKPGGYLLCFSGTRTHDLMNLSIRLGGFEIIDVIAWVYSQGMPKSHNVSKAIDKKKGKQRKVIGMKENQVRTKDRITNAAFNGVQSGGMFNPDRTHYEITEPASDEAIEFDGYGTGLKPAFEPITIAQKPFHGTIADNVLMYGTGSLNVKECRVPGFQTHSQGPNRFQKTTGGSFAKFNEHLPVVQQMGWWPANLIHDGSEEVVELFPKSKGMTGGGKHKQDYEGGMFGSIDCPVIPLREVMGSAARFFYCAKASKKDKNEGLTNNNQHPTVKPNPLMRYLCKLVGRKNSVILDPYMGSGSTGKACSQENMFFLGSEFEEESFETAMARVMHAFAEQQSK